MSASQRIDVVDALRGYALLGLFLVHCVERFELYWLDPRPDGWFELVFALFAGKAFAIFALLFGFSFATMMENERRRGGDFTLRFAWRLVLLFLIGTVHALVYRGDILQVLAAVGLVMIPFDRLRSAKLLLVCAVLLFLQFPLLLRAWAALQGAGWATAAPLFWGDSGLAVLATGGAGEVLVANAGPGMASKWSYYAETGRLVEIAGLFLVGMVLQRQRLLADAGERRRLWLAVLLAGATAWAFVAAAAPALLPPAPDAGGTPMVRTSLEAAFDQWRNLAAMAFQVAAFVLLWQLPAGRILWAFVPTGRMTLTLYVGQSLVAVPLLYGSGFGLWDDLSHAQAVLWGLAAFALQIALAAWWLHRFRYGPLEWLWRAGTRTTLAVPLRC